MAVTSKEIVQAIQGLTNIEKDLHLENIPKGAGFWWQLVHLDPAIYRGVVVSIIGILTSCGLVISDQNTAGVVTIVAAVVAFIQAIWTRGAVTPNQKVLAYKPDPIGSPTVVLPGDAVSSDVIAVSNAAAAAPTNPTGSQIPFPASSFGSML